MATLGLRTGRDWGAFVSAAIDFLSSRWSHWGIGYGDFVGERQFVFNVGVIGESESRRDEVSQWLGQRDDVLLISTGIIKGRGRFRPSRRGRSESS